MGKPDDHRIEMLRLLCAPHHNKRSSAQANAAKRARQAQRRRPKPKHPGLIG
jgi:hypothetical protein